MLSSRKVEPTNKKIYIYFIRFIEVKRKRARDKNTECNTFFYEYSTFLVLVYV